MTFIEIIRERYSNFLVFIWMASIFLLVIDLILKSTIYSTIWNEVLLFFVKPPGFRTGFVELIRPFKFQ